MAHDCARHRLVPVPIEHEPAVRAFLRDLEAIEAGKHLDDPSRHRADADT